MKGRPILLPGVTTYLLETVRARGVIADCWGILTAFYFLAGTVFVANLVVMAIPDKGKESAVLVEEPA